jgi:hypothetical protein
MGGDAPSNTRYLVSSTSSGEHSETYMLDKQNGRVWMMRGQVSEGPFMIPCLYQLSDGRTALSAFVEVPTSVSTNDRFSMKSASGGQYVQTYVLDKQSGRVWMMRGQVSKSPFLLPCVYQLSNGKTSSTPVGKASSTSSVDDRFSIACTTSGQHVETYVFDTQTGCVWQVRGQVSKSPFFLPCAYQLLNGSASSTPMDENIEIDLMKAASQNSTSQDSQGVVDDSSEHVPVELPSDLKRKLDGSKKKMDEDLEKLFPQ